MSSDSRARDVPPTLAGGDDEKRLAALPPKPIDYRRLLTIFFDKYDPEMVSEVDELLNKNSGKEPKLCLILAKKYEKSNPLNAVFTRLVGSESTGTDGRRDYLALTKLYLSVFFPQDVGQAEALCGTYAGKEKKLFKKLAANFHAIDPMKMPSAARADKADDSRTVDYKEVLTTFYERHDKEKVADVEDTLSKCRGKEAILFAVFAKEYDTENALNVVFKDRLRDAEDCKDYLAVLKLYLSVFHPTKISEAKSMLSKWQGKERHLFTELAAKFRAIDALGLCDELGITFLDSIEEAEEDGAPIVIPDEVVVCASPKRNAPIPQSPAVTPKRNARVATIPQSPAVTP
ncbi:hypothetical protein ACHAWF_013827 [Thalassiosira exigua]